MSSIPVDDLLCDLDALLLLAREAGMALARSNGASGERAHALFSAYSAVQNRYASARDAFQGRMRQIGEEEIDDLRAPAGLSPEVTVAHAAIVTVLHRFDATHTGGCRCFYTPSQWRAAEHASPGAPIRASSPALLIVCYEGSRVADAFRLGDAPATLAAMEEALGALGLFLEEIDGVSSAIYRLR